MVKEGIMRGNFKLAEEARQDQIVADADEWARFLDEVEREVRRDCRERRLGEKSKRAPF
jgi:hypothetical protein